MTSLLSLVITNIIVLYMAWVLYTQADTKKDIEHAFLLKNSILLIDLFYIDYILAWAVTR
jgi:hypothetical protein